MLDICTDKVWAMCCKWKDATIFDANENYHSAEGLIQRPPKNQHGKKKCSRLVHSAEASMQQLKNGSQ